MGNWDKSDQATTPRANGSQLHQGTPGLGIGLATPGPGATLPGVPEEAVSSPLGPPEKSNSGDKDDYFTGGSAVVSNAPATESSEAKTSMENGNEKGKDKDKDKASDTTKSPGSTFGKKFRMSFSTKKLGRSSSQATQEKPVVVDEKAEESESSSTNEKEVDDSFFGVLQKIRNDYDKQFADTPEKLIETRVTPSLPNETPVLKLPPGTKVIIQEETSGGSANVYQGTVENVGNDADVIEQKAPMWLGDVLLQNLVPFKEPVKISFVLHPMGDLTTLSPADGNNRLNANRMLRVKKILAYVAERIEEVPEEPEENALPPEEYLELYCNDQVSARPPPHKASLEPFQAFLWLIRIILQLLDPMMSLATIRTHVWKSGNDVVLYYKANGRKEIIPPKPAASMIPADTPGAQGPVGAAAPTEPATTTAAA